MLSTTMKPTLYDRPILCDCPPPYEAVDTTPIPAEHQITALAAELADKLQLLRDERTEARSAPTTARINKRCETTARARQVLEAAGKQATEWRVMCARLKLYPATERIKFAAALKADKRSFEKALINRERKARAEYVFKAYAVLDVAHATRKTEEKERKEKQRLLRFTEEARASETSRELGGGEERKCRKRDERMRARAKRAVRKNTRANAATGSGEHQFCAGSTRCVSPLTPGCRCPYH